MDEQMAQTPSPSQEARPSIPTGQSFEDQPLQQRAARKQSIVPMVSVQQATPILSADSEADRRSPVSDEDIQQKMARRESLPKAVQKQESLGGSQMQLQQEVISTSEEETGGSSVEEVQPEERDGVREVSQQPQRSDAQGR